MTAADSHALATRRSRNWRAALALTPIAALVIAANLFLVGRSVALILGDAPAVDWDQYVDASRRWREGGLYAVTDTYAYHYSPLLAPLFGPLALIGTLGWRLLHIVAVACLPTWPMRLAAVVSWPFWYDVEAGNLLIFVVLAAAWAIRGNRAATGLYLLLLLLVPRPLMLPVGAWLLLRRPEWRMPFAAAFAVHLVAVAATGWGADWFSAMLAASGDAMIPSNIGPSRFLGVVPSLAIGIPLGAWLTWRGRLGLASLAVSPYWLPYYLLMLILELPARDSAYATWWRDRRRRAHATAGPDG